MRQGKRAIRVSALVAVGAVLAAGVSHSPAASASARGRASSLLSSPITISPVDYDKGARRIGLASQQIVIQSDSNGTAHVKLNNPAPYARIVPITGDPYYVSAGELAQSFTALLGQAPTVGISYGEGSRQRSMTLTQSVTPPIYDIASQSISFDAEGAMPAVGSTRALVTFIATAASSRPTVPSGKAPEIITESSSARSRAGQVQPRSGSADASAAYAYSPTFFTSPGTPPTLLSANQVVQNVSTSTGTTQIGKSTSCVTYDPSQVSVGGTITTSSGLATMSTSTQVSQSVNAGTSASMKAGGLKTSMSAAYTGTTQQDSASVYAVGTVSTAGIATSLSPSLAADVTKIAQLSDAVNFIGNCGDQAGTGYLSGATYQSILQMQTTSQSDAQSLAASLSASYKSPGTSTTAGGSFSATVASNKSVQNVVVTEVCVGPTSCGSVAGYAGIDTSSVTNALNSFNSDFNAMANGLGGVCANTTTAATCVVQMLYEPIEDLVPPSASNAKTLISQASNGVYWMLTNAQAWANGYQSLATAYNQAATYTKMNPPVATYIAQAGSTTTLTSDQLTTQANSYQSKANALLNWAATTCGGANVNAAAGGCSNAMVACATDVMANGPTTANCLPSSLSAFSTYADPSTLSGPIMLSPPATCNAAYPSTAHANPGNAKTTLYLGGNQAVGYPVWCVWDSNGASYTYLQVSGSTSQSDAGTTTFAYVPFDPTTGSIYASATNFPSNADSSVEPSCSYSPCLPFGYAQTGSGKSAHTLVMDLPTSLAFASSTNVRGSGNLNLTTPARTGVVSNTWTASQPASGSSLIEDSNLKGSGITLVVPSNTNLAFASTGAAPSVITDNGATACALSSSGKTTNSGDASSNSSNQQLSNVGFAGGVTGKCTATLYETNWKNPGKPVWWDSTWYVNSEWGPLYPTFICGTQEAGKAGGNAELYYTVGAPTTSGSPLSAGWYASTASNEKPWMSVEVIFDNYNTALSATKSGTTPNIGGQCPSNAVPIDGQ